MNQNQIINLTDDLLYGQELTKNVFYTLLIIIYV